MPHISALKQSKFLTRADCGRGILCTIKGVHEENIAKEGAPPEMKWCLSFHEQEKPMVLNITNGNIIAQITKSEDTDDWTGHKVVLYDDPTISFGGKLVGGIRVRAPRNQQPAKTAPAKRQPVAPPPPIDDAYEHGCNANENDEDVPF